MVEYTLTRSKRKTIGLYIKDGILEIRTPLKCSQSEIDKLVAEKENWIRDKLSYSKSLSKKREDFTLNYGSKILYLGEEYPIIKKAGSRVGFDNGFYMPQDLSQDEIKDACIQIYRLLAKRDLTNKAHEFSKQMNVMPVAVKINDAKTRWGSCSSRKSINFSWRLIMADSAVVDYVTVHELAHLTEMNHSAKFWSIVENVLPDYRERKSRLRKLQKRLSTENWGVAE